MQLSSKNDLATFWAVLEKIGQLFIPPSGHTVDTPKYAPRSRRRFLLFKKLIFKRSALEVSKINYMGRQRQFSFPIPFLSSPKWFANCPSERRQHMAASGCRPHT